MLGPEWRWGTRVGGRHLVDSCKGAYRRSAFRCRVSPWVVPGLLFFESTYMDGYRTDGLTLWTSDGVNFCQGSDEAPFTSWTSSYHGHCPLQYAKHRSTAQHSAGPDWLVSRLLWKYILRRLLLRGKRNKQNTQTHGIRESRYYSVLYRHGCIQICLLYTSPSPRD